MANEEFKKVDDILNEFGTKLLTDSYDSLKKFGHTANGQSSLFGKFRFQVKRQTNGNLTFFFYMPPHGDYIDVGTRGAKRKGTGGEAMVKSIEDWIQARSSLTSVANKLRSEYKVKGIVKRRERPISFVEAKHNLAYAIKRSINKRGIIKRFGYKGSGFFTSLLKDGRVQKFEEALAKELGTEVKIIITNGLIKGKL